MLAMLTGYIANHWSALRRPGTKLRCSQCRTNEQVGLTLFCCGVTCTFAKFLGNCTDSADEMSLP